MKLFNLAVKNMRRNKKRTLLSSLAILFAAIIIAIAYGWIEGMVDNYMESYKKFQSGNFRVMVDDYMKKEKFKPVDIFIKDGARLENDIDSLLIKNFPEKDFTDNFDSVQRINFGGLAGKGQYSGPVAVLGLEPEKEKARFKFGQNIVSGSPDLDPSEVIIGTELAAKLHIKAGDSFLIASTTYLSGMNAKKFKVGGIVKLTLSAMNSSFVFMNITDARNLLKFGNTNTTEIVYFFPNDYTEKAVGLVSGFLETNGGNYGILNLSGETNGKIILQDIYSSMGPLYGTMKIMEQFFIFFYIIILFLASFVIINTMMMNIFERINEIGTLKAIGLKDREVFFLNFYEGAMIGALGGIPGSLLGYFLTLLMNKVGLDFTQMFKSVDFLIETIIRPRASVDVLLASLVLSIIVPALATILPSRYAKKLNPVEALRHL